MHFDPILFRSLQELKWIITVTIVNVTDLNIHLQALMLVKKFGSTTGGSLHLKIHLKEFQLMNKISNRMPQHTDDSQERETSVCDFSLVQERR